MYMYKRKQRRIVAAYAIKGMKFLLFTFEIIFFNIHISYIQIWFGEYN